jgi:hypothetical protein
VTLVVAPNPRLVACDQGLSLLRRLRRQGDEDERKAAQEAINDLLDERLRLMGVELVGRRP